MEWLPCVSASWLLAAGLFHHGCHGWTEIWGIWTPSNCLGLFVIFLKPFMSRFRSLLVCTALLKEATVIKESHCHMGVGLICDNISVGVDMTKWNLAHLHASRSSRFPLQNTALKWDCQFHSLHLSVALMRWLINVYLEHYWYFLCMALWFDWSKMYF